MFGMENKSKIFLAGHKGMVGSAIFGKLAEKGYENIVVGTRSELDLTRQEQVELFFEKESPEYVFLAAAKVGGILANSTIPAEFIYENLQIQANVIHAAHKVGVRKLLFLGSSCIYPRDCPQPMKEEYLLSGGLEKTNEAYAVAKIAGIKMCQYYHEQYGDDFLSVMPTNLYGPNDNFDLESSHVLPALVRKFHEAREKWDASSERERKGIFVTIWGTGSPFREFLHVDDMAEGCIFVMNNISSDALHGNGISHLNIGTGKEISIARLAETIKKVAGFEGRISYDSEKPDGTPRKLLDVSRLASFGWKYKIELGEGIERTYEWFRKNEYRQKSLQ